MPLQVKPLHPLLPWSHQNSCFCFLRFCGALPWRFFPKQPGRTCSVVTGFSAVLQQSFYHVHIFFSLAPGMACTHCFNIEFRQEINIQGRLHHPNILQIVGIILKPFCILTELCEHGELYSYIHNYHLPLHWDLKLKVWLPLHLLLKQPNALPWSGQLVQLTNSVSTRCAASFSFTYSHLGPFVVKHVFFRSFVLLE